jgi:exonuclease VII large subunit
MVLQKDAPVTRAKSLRVGDEVELRFSDGSAKAAVTQAAGEVSG